MGAVERAGILDHAEGMRMDPPWSPPIAMSASPVATSTALPLAGAAARIMGLLVRVKDSTGGAGKGGARKTEIFANGLSDDISACVQDAGSYRMIAR